jgi:2-polyprenyl-3-methyl-5-hydroxy-6-metoxy-1,4-benzoquinol methylase
MNAINSRPICWCGNDSLSPFSGEYLLCENCKTLVLKEWPEKKNFLVVQDDQDFYGRSYWFEHQENDLQFGNIISRARSDVPERILHWLNTLLKYKLPPGKTLELGCSHGGFVAILQWAGFQASGLELSPWVVDFARQTFQIPMYLGRLEDQEIKAGSLDVVILMDVLEHLPDPISTISAAIALLKKDGVLIIQTPCYPEGRSFESLQKENDPFLLMFQVPEHIYLFSQSSVRQLLNAVNLPYVQFETAYFGMYDMFLLASQTPFKANTQEVVDETLMTTPGGRLILALLDINNQLQESEKDRAARLDQIHQYDVWLKESQITVKELDTKLQKIGKSYIYKVGKGLGLF